RLFGDRFSGQGSRYEGPSFGDWPHLSAARLEYDGDYRLPVRTELASVSTQSVRVEDDGARRSLREVYRIRVVTLRSDEGRLSWEYDAPAAASCHAFRAYSGTRGAADLEL